MLSFAVHDANKIHHAIFSGVRIFFFIIFKDQFLKFLSLYIYIDRYIKMQFDLDIQSHLEIKLIFQMGTLIFNPGHEKKERNFEISRRNSIQFQI